MKGLCGVSLSSRHITHEALESGILLTLGFSCLQEGRDFGDEYLAELDHIGE